MPFLTYGMEWLGPKRSLKWLVKEQEHLIAKVDTIYCAMKVFNSLVFYSPKPVRTDVDIDAMVQKLKSAEPCMGLLSEKKYRHFYAALAPFMAV
ncbi:MAG: hypothetical protein WCQ99_11430, partial [Pseudomonadota bacterium]